MIDLINSLYNNLDETTPGNDSYEHCLQSEKTEKLYDDLYALLNDEQKEKLRRLSNEYFMLHGMAAKDSEKFIHGFKTAFRLILQTLN